MARFNIKWLQGGGSVTVSDSVKYQPIEKKILPPDMFKPVESPKPDIPLIDPEKFKGDYHSGAFGKHLQVKIDKYNNLVNSLDDVDKEIYAKELADMRNEITNPSLMLQMKEQYQHTQEGRDQAKANESFGSPAIVENDVWVYATDPDTKQPIGKRISIEEYTLNKDKEGYKPMTWAEYTNYYETLASTNLGDISNTEIGWNYGAPLITKKAYERLGHIGTLKEGFEKAINNPEIDLNNVITLISQGREDETNVPHINSALEAMLNSDPKIYKSLKGIAMQQVSPVKEDGTRKTEKEISEELYNKSKAILLQQLVPSYKTTGKTFYQEGAYSDKDKEKASKENEIIRGFWSAATHPAKDVYGMIDLQVTTIGSGQVPVIGQKVPDRDDYKKIMRNIIYLDEPQALDNEGKIFRKTKNMSDIISKTSGDLILANGTVIDSSALSELGLEKALILDESLPELVVRLPTDHRSIKTFMDALKSHNDQFKVDIANAKGDTEKIKEIKSQYGATVDQLAASTIGGTEKMGLYTIANLVSNEENVKAVVKLTKGTDEDKAFENLEDNLSTSKNKWGISNVGKYMENVLDPFNAEGNETFEDVWTLPILIPISSSVYNDTEGTFRSGYSTTQEASALNSSRPIVKTEEFGNSDGNIDYRANANNPLNKPR